jgi:GNAT superfamily N-acetyltransferase
VIEVRRIPADSPDALALVDAMWREIQEQYPPIPGATTPSATPEDFSPPGGCFVALYDGNRAVAGGGIKRLEEGIAEIKRMYVVSDRRGQGLARELLLGLEDAARSLGYVRTRLDTGDKQPHAEALYRSAGYRPIHNYNDNAYASFWGEKNILTERE